MFETLELPGGGELPPWPPYQGFALDPLGAFNGPQTPRPIIVHPPFLIPGFGPGMVGIKLAYAGLVDQHRTNGWQLSWPDEKNDIELTSFVDVGPTKLPTKC